MHVCLYMGLYMIGMVPAEARRQHSSDALELELKVIVSYVRWVLETELGCSARSSMNS